MASDTAQEPLLGGRGGAREPRGGAARAAALGWVGWAVAVVVPLAFLGVFFAWPTAALVARGFVTEGALDLSGFAEVLGRPRTWRFVGLTLLQASLGTGFSLLLGLPAAYVLYRCTFRGRTVLRALVTVPFVLPTVVVGVAFRALLASSGPLGFLDLDGSLAAIVAALVFFNYAVVVRTVGGLWERLDPRAEEAARALGASPWRAFVSVTLPMLAPAIASAASIVFLFCATAFGVVLILGGTRYGTIETEIWVQTTQFLDLRAAAVLSVAQLVVITVVLAVSAYTRRSRERALHLAGTVVRLRPLRLRPSAATGWGDLVPAAVTAAVGLGLLAFPLVHLLVASFRTPSGWGLGNYVALGTTGGPNALSVTVWDALLTSLRTAVDATVIAVVVGTLVALVVSRRPRSRTARRAIGLMDAAVMLPLGVSAVTVGFGFLITLNRPPLDLRSSLVLIPIAQAVVAIPLVVRTVLPVLRAIDPRLREVAAVLGATPGRVLAHVDGPFLVRSLGLAVGFAFAVSLGEFGATAFLARPDRPTLPVVVVRLLSRPGAENYGMALAAAVVLALLTATIMGIAERLRSAGGAGSGEW
ncbi:ABC transporter permease [Pseudactinotalea suaedae]|uniref:ABC transporter permease n=1 Tax=Pseudactinotalea suaedae TaxID=1524924 RepID=UPI0012E31358|nr:iron ABC transporter permease [Pseudactinotalea suaedae]